MKLFDTHVHFCRLGGEYTQDAQVTRAKEAGITRMVAVGGSCELNKGAVDAATDHPELIRIALGFDRDQTEALATPDKLQDAIDRIELAITQLPQRNVHVCAIGEIGLDYHYSPESAPEQRALFEAQLDLANKHKLPVVIHSREADEDTLEILKKHADSWQGDPTRIGVLHCFTGGAEFAAELITLGFHISFSGIVTFLNADPLRSAAKEIPADRLLIETDSPYLAPAPMRGNRNEPAFVRHVAEHLAEVRSVEVETLADQTYANGSHLFGWL